MPLSSSHHAIFLSIERFVRTQHVLHKYTERLTKRSKLFKFFFISQKKYWTISHMYLSYHMSIFSHVLFQEETVRLIYSYSDHKDLRYHGRTKRGTKSVSLLSEVQVPETMPSDIRHIEFLNRNVSCLLFTSKE